jgi:hypothetical protein
VNGHLHVPVALPPGIHSQYPLNRRLGGPQNLSGRYSEEKIILPVGHFEKTIFIQNVFHKVMKNRLNLRIMLEFI